MNLNILAYCIYCSISIFITIYVGKQFHKNGYFFIVSIFKNESISTSINNLLLVGYYLVNIGFVILKISQWQPIKNIQHLTEEISTNVALVMILLGLLNIINVSVLSFFRKQKLNIHP